MSPRHRVDLTTRRWVGSRSASTRGVVVEWRSLFERAVWSVCFVVVDVVDDQAFELVLVPDVGAVEELSSQGPDPSFGEGVRDWCSDWGFDDVEAFGSEDFVECVDELAAAVADQRPRIGEAVGVA